MNEFKLGIFALIKLVMLTLYSAHICAIILYKFENWEKEQNIQYTWIDLMSLNNNPWHDKYIAALYFSVITMITVGFGDIYPVNTYEFILIILITLVSCGVFAYCINSIGQIVQRITQKGNNLQNQLSQLTTYMKMKNIQNRLLQIKIKQYYEYLFNEEHKEYQIGEKIISELVGNVKREVMIEIYGQILQKNKFFYLNFSQQLIDELSQEMQEIKIAPQHQIPENSKDLYFLISGIVYQQVSYNKSQKNLKQIQQDEIFNERKFFQDYNDDSKFIAQNVVQVSILKYENFYEILKKFPKDREKFFQFKDYYLFSQKQRGLEMKCEICNNYKHRFIDCPQIFFIGKKEQLLYKYNNMNGSQKRLRHYRQNSMNINSLEMAGLVRDDGIRLIATYTQFQNQKEMLKCLNKIQQAHISYLDYTKQLIIQQEQQLKQEYQEQFYKQKQEIVYTQTPKHNNQTNYTQKRDSLRNSVVLPSNITNSYQNFTSQISALPSNTEIQKNHQVYQNNSQRDLNIQQEQNTNYVFAVANTTTNNNNNQGNSSLYRKSGNVSKYNNNNQEMVNSPLLQQSQGLNKNYQIQKNLEDSRNLGKKSSLVSNQSVKRKQKQQNSIILENSIDLNTINYIRQQATKTSTIGQKFNKQRQQSHDDYKIQEPEIKHYQSSNQLLSYKQSQNINGVNSPIHQQIKRGTQKHFSLNYKIDQNVVNTNIYKELSPTYSKTDVYSLESSSNDNQNKQNYIKMNLSNQSYRNKKSLDNQSYKKKISGDSSNNLFKNKKNYNNSNDNQINDDQFTLYSLQSSQDIDNNLETFYCKTMNQIEEFDDLLYLNNNKSSISKQQFSCIDDMDIMMESQYYFQKQNYYNIINEINKKIMRNLKKIEQKTNKKYDQMLINNQLIGKNRKISQNIFQNKSKEQQENIQIDINNINTKSNKLQIGSPVQNISNNIYYNQSTGMMEIKREEEKKLSKFAIQYKSSKKIEETHNEEIYSRSKSNTIESFIQNDVQQNESVNHFLGNK